MVEWWFAKEKINERGSYILVEWSREKKKINEDPNFWWNGHAKKKEERINERRPYILLHMFCLFVPSVTQGNEDAVRVQGFAFLLLVLIKGIRR